MRPNRSKALTANIQFQIEELKRATYANSAPVALLRTLELLLEKIEKLEKQIEDLST